MEQSKEKAYVKKNLLQEDRLLHFKTLRDKYAIEIHGKIYSVMVNYSVYYISYVQSVHITCLCVNLERIGNVVSLKYHRAHIMSSCA